MSLLATLLLATGVEIAFAVGSLVVSAGLAAASYFLMKPKAGAIGPTRNFSATTLAAQGAYIPLLIGRRRLGCVFAWAGNRRFVASAGGGGGGKGGRKARTKDRPPIYIEEGWHLICVGPAYRLHRIWADGKLIWEGPINADTHPSGTEVTVEGTAENSFTIYWGEPDQPVNTWLGDAGRVGIESRWPGVCYVVWTKELGNSPRWPQIEYDIQVDPNYTPGCAQTEVVVGTLTGSPITTSSTSVSHVGLTGADTDTLTRSLVIATEGWYRFTESTADYSSIYFGTSNNKHAGALTAITVTLDGQTLLSESNLGVLSGSLHAGFGSNVTPDCWTYANTNAASAAGTAKWQRSFVGRTIYLPAGTLTLQVQATITQDGSGADNQHILAINPFEVTLLTDPVGGANPIAALGHLLFTPWPGGLGFDSTRYLFDPDALHSCAETCDDEGLMASIVAENGEAAHAVITGLMQDIGLVWRKNYETQYHEFALVRSEASPTAVTQIGESPEVEIIHVERPVDRLGFSFPDVSRNFRDTVITIDEDGQPIEAVENEVRRGSVVPLATAIEYKVAEKIAERRSQEEMASLGRFNFTAGKAARLLLPGQAVEVEGIDPILRVNEITLDPDGFVSLQCIHDHYGVPLSTVDHDPSSVAGTELSAAQDNAWETFVEVPEWFTSDNAPGIFPLRVRAHDGIGAQVLHLSGDGTTYRDVDTDYNVHSGGQLSQAVAADTAWVLDTGWTFDLLGADVGDIDLVEDLSSDALNWALGRQILVIDEEICYLKKVTNLGGGSYRLDGIIRGRLGTTPAAHSDNTPFVICTSETLFDVVDPLVSPGRSLRLKQQAVASLSLSLASVTATTKTIYGKGLVPSAPSALRVTAPRPGSLSYRTGEDVTFAWGYSSNEMPGTGAGMQGAGVAVGQSEAKGTFEVIVLTTLDVVVATYSGTGDGVTSTGFTYANADIVADLGSETSFKVQVRNIRGGYRSNAATATVTKL